MVKFKDFSRPLSVFQVLFKANFIFKDFSRQSCIFKYFSSLSEPCSVNADQPAPEGKACQGLHCLTFSSQYFTHLLRLQNTSVQIQDKFTW